MEMEFNDSIQNDSDLHTEPYFINKNIVGAIYILLNGLAIIGNSFIIC